MLKPIGITLAELMFAMVLIVAGTAGATAEPRLALVIGNSDYAFSPRLDNPVNDARLMDAKLRSVGFDVTLAQNLDYQPMKRAFLDFTERVRHAGPQAVALIYYSGHGIQVHDQNYLVPTNAKLDREIDADVEGIPLNGVLSYLEDAQPHEMIVILDACRDNPLKSGTRSVAQRGLARITTPRSSFVAYSAEPGSTASDGSGQDSPFTLALSQYIDRPGLTIDQVFNKVRIDVNRNTGGSQTPRTDSGLLEDFYFKPASGAFASPIDTLAPRDADTKPALTLQQQSICAGDADPESLLQRANEAGTAEAYSEVLRLCPNHPKKDQIQQARDLAAEGAVWKLAQQQNTVDSYRKFLLFYPSGVYAQDAQRALAKVAGADEAAAWTHAQQANTVESYRDYLNEFKDGAHAGDAGSRMSGLQLAALTPSQSQPSLRPQSSLPARLITRHPGYDLYGGDYQSIAGSNYASCLQQCTGDTRCIGFTFNTKRDVCILKQGWNHIYRNAEADSGIVQAEAEGQPSLTRAFANVQLYDNTDFLGGDYDNVKGITLDSCREICLGDSNCHAFTYILSKRWCWLKGDNASARPKSNVVSGLKQ
jgi:uncharacterized caspase-like protein